MIGKGKSALNLTWVLLDDYFLFVFGLQAKPYLFSMWTVLMYLFLSYFSFYAIFWLWFFWLPGPFLFSWQYAEKLFVRRPKDNRLSVAQQIWEAVHANDKKAVYRYIVNSNVDVNVAYEQMCNSSLTLAKVMLLQEQTSHDHSSTLAGNTLDWSSSKEGPVMDNLDGCTLLHLACETADIGMVELLLQYGANVNATDSRGQTPLHRCILKGRSAFARLMLSRWFRCNNIYDDISGSFNNLCIQL